MRLMTVDAKMTRKSAGRMNSAMGKTSLTTAFRTASSAGDAAAELLGLYQEGQQSPHLVHADAVRQARHRLAARHARLDLVRHQLQLFADQKPLIGLLLRHANESGVEPESGLDADDEKVERVGKRLLDRQRARARPALEMKFRQQIPEPGERGHRRHHLGKRRERQHGQDDAEDAEGGGQKETDPPENAQRALPGVTGAVEELARLGVSRRQLLVTQKEIRDFLPESIRRSGQKAHRAGRLAGGNGVEPLPDDLVLNGRARGEKNVDQARDEAEYADGHEQFHHSESLNMNPHELAEEENSQNFHDAGAEQHPLSDGVVPRGLKQLWIHEEHKGG